MKKTFTLFTAVMMLASVCFAQSNARRVQPGEKAAVVPVTSVFKAKHKAKAASQTAFKAAGDTVDAFPWIEDFESGVAPVGFSFIDADGDGFNWDYTYLFNDGGYGHNGSEGMVGSASYDIDTRAALHPDNWMILPAISVPQNASNFILSWWDKGQDADYFAEKYSVYICTSGRTVADFTATTAVYSGQTVNDWEKRTVDISSYANQTIYIAFRHHNVSDMFFLDIDDIRVGDPEPPELTLYGPTFVRVDQPAQFVAVAESNTTIAWFVDGASESNTSDTLDYTFTTDGMHQVVATATNNTNLLSSSDTLNVNVFSCENINLPYAPNFSTGLECWDTICDSTHNTGWYPTVEMFDEPVGQVMSISVGSNGLQVVDIPVDNWLVSPEIAMPTTGEEYEVAWKVAPYTTRKDGDHYGIYVINGGDTTLLWEESLTGLNGFNQRMAIIPSTISGDFQVAFRHFNNEGGYAIILDSIQIRALTAPELTLNGPTEAINGNTVSFTAIAPNAESFVWTIDGVEQSETGYTLTTSFTTDGFHTVGVTVSNNEGSDEDSIVVDVYSCNVISQFPLVQDFENGIRCWTKVSMDPANDNRFGIDTVHYAGNYGFRFSSFSSASDYNQYLITPELSLPTEGEYMVKFMYRAYGTNYAEPFSVLASSTTSDIAAFTTVLGSYEHTNNEWTEVAFPLPANTKYVAINYYGHFAYYLYIDNFSVEAINIVPIVELEGPESAETHEQVVFVANAPLATSFAWTVDGTAASETGQVLTVSFDTPGIHSVSVVATNSVGNSAPVTASIDVYTCDVNAPWTEDFEGNTDCWTFYTADGMSHGFVINPNGQYQYSHSGNYCLFGTYSDDVNVDQWAFSPAITMPQDATGYLLSYYVHTTAWEGIPTKYEVRLSTGSTNIEDFTVMLYTEQDSARFYKQRIVDMSQYAGQTIRLAFRNLTPMGGDAMMFDDIEISNTVSINDVAAESKLDLYPNPASTTVNVSTEGIEGKVIVSIVDLNGRVMMQQQGNAQNFTFDVRNLAQGAYFVHMTGENINAVRKLVVK